MSDQASDRANAPEARSRRSSFRRVAHSALLPLAGLWSCADTAMNSRASAQPAIQIDSTEYVWQVERDKLTVKIPWTFTNATPDTIFFKRNCRAFPEPTLEKLVGGEWQRAAGGERTGPDCAFATPGDFILPGASRGDNVEFAGYVVSRAINISVFPFDDFDGTYRLNWSNLAFDPHLFRSREDLFSLTRPLPPDVEIVSPPFTLIDPRDGR